MSAYPTRKHTSRRRPDPTARFRSLPLVDRWHLGARWRSCPFDALLAELPVEGRVADLGCGHGLLCALAAAVPTRRMLGLDPDERKIELARACLADLPNVELRVGDVADLPTGLDAIVICDVLYLLPPAQWRRTLETCRKRLKPGGKLILKEAGVSPAWKHRKALLQERLMIRLLGRTRSSGGLHFQPAAETEVLLQTLGFQVDRIRDLGRGFSTAHLLFVAHLPA